MQEFGTGITYYDTGWANMQGLGTGVTYAVGDRGLLDLGFRVMRLGRSYFDPEQEGQQGLHLDSLVRKRIVVGFKIFCSGIIND